MENTTENTASTEKCVCGCKHNWTHRTPARIIVAIALGVVVFSIGWVLGGHHGYGYGYGYGRTHFGRGYGMMGMGGMMGGYRFAPEPGGNVQYQYRMMRPLNLQNDGTNVQPGELSQPTVPNNK